MQTIIDLSKVGLGDIAEVGGKNASLGEMIAKLTPLGIRVPPGFAVTASAYRLFLRENQLTDAIASRLADLDVTQLRQLKEASKQIRHLIRRAVLPNRLVQDISAAYAALGLTEGQSVAVRSSATAEDLPTASFAGQQETYLNVVGISAVLTAIKDVYASLYTERAIAYRVHHGFAHDKVAISVGIQRMIRSDLAASGVMFTLDTESGYDQVVFITSAYGLGELVVQGAVNPDEFFVHKPTLAIGKQSIISRKLGTKEHKMIYARARAVPAVKQVSVPSALRQQFSLTDAEVLELARQAMILEQHYGQALDIEWAKDGLDQQLYITQARPETVKARDAHLYFEQYHLQTAAKPLISGRSVGQKIGQGAVRIIKNPKKMHVLQKGEVLVADMTDPDWEPIMKLASAIITNRGGRTCHAAIVARELGIPAVVGCGNATRVLEEGKPVTVSCAEGETGYIYPGLMPFEVERKSIQAMPPLPVQVCMNLANPEQAFTCQFLPNHGIGLARLEFIISNMIGIHPNALLNVDKLPRKLQKAVLTRTQAYANPVEFYIEKLAEGIATIAAAFYPKPIIVRFSDFKSNEYANLLGGAEYEPKEENPMIGYRGASRYLTGNFRECFALECEALRRVRTLKGLDNTHIMFPFARTVQEAKQLVDLVASYGLERGKEGLKIYMMCEIPSNALLAEEFLHHFDGYSIGSNDLTQLTLGLDRDSALVANLFDERDLAVKTFLKHIISTCRRMDKYVGICGQGPSDHPDFAKWLMAEGIMSVSLTPDSIVRTWLALGNQEPSSPEN